MRGQRKSTRGRSESSKPEEELWYSNENRHTLDFVFSGMYCIVSFQTHFQTHPGLWKRLLLDFERGWGSWEKIKLEQTEMPTKGVLLLSGNFSCIQSVVAMTATSEEQGGSSTSSKQQSCTAASCNCNQNLVWGKIFLMKQHHFCGHSSLVWFDFFPICLNKVASFKVLDYRFSNVNVSEKKWCSKYQKWLNLLYG